MGLQFPLTTRIGTEEKNTAYVHRARRGLPRFVVFDGGEKGKEMEGEVGNLEWPALAPLGSALPPKVGVWCRRDVIPGKVRRKKNTAYVRRARRCLQRFVVLC